jgi:hypothetical protein
LWLSWVLLEKLNPTERAVFLLREVFDYEYAEISPMLGINEANCRQIFRRARQRQLARRPTSEWPSLGRHHADHSSLRAKGGVVADKPTGT